MSLKRIFRTIVITIFVFLVVFYYQAYTLYKRSVMAQKWVTHTNVVINRLGNIYADIWELQGEHKQVPNKSVSLQMQNDIRTNLESLATLLHDNAEQRKRLDQLSGFVYSKFDLLDKADKKENQMARLMVLDDSIKSTIGILIRVENNLLSSRTESYEYYSERRFLFSLVSFSLLGLFLFISLYQIYKNLVKRNEAERLVLAHEAKYKRLIESSQFTTAIIGKDRKVEFVSSNIEQLTGIRKEELQNEEINVPVPSIDEWKRDPKPFVDMELKIQHRTQGEKWIAYRVFPLYTEQGEIEEQQIVAWDINNEKQMKEELSQMNYLREQQQKLLQDIIDNIPSAVYIKDRTGKYVIVNKKFCEIWNRRSEDILGHRDIDVFNDQMRRDNYHVADKQVLQYKSMVTLEDTMVHDGQIDHYWIIKFPLLDERGDVQNICGLATDITERKESEFKLLKATRAAESARVAQEAFLANMSHEIRTPMNGIMGMSNLLLSTTQTSEQKEYAESILESARHLLAIINDILDFSKIKAGKFHLENIPFKPRHVVKKAIYPLQFKADEKMVRLRLELEDGLPEVVVGDPLRLQQIIINLVGNALKFTEKGSVQVTVRCKDTSPGHCIMDVLVTDTGIGIAPEKQQMIFESFTQNNVNTSRKYGGTGLGLAIVKQLVEMQKGKVWVESVPGEGSTFGFSIPYKTGKMPESTEAIRPANITGDHKLLTDIKVLVAEDNLINQKVVNITLLKQGADVFIAGNGKLAIEALKAQPFDVILMDLQMPEVDGYQATRIIRKEINNTIPIVAMTADALKGEAEKCFEAGMNGYISKPFEPKELYQEIIRLTKKNNIMSQDNTSRPPVDLSYLFELSGHDPVYISEVLDLFLGTMGDGLDQLEHMIRETNDWDGIYRQAHFLKSSVSVVQVRDMFDNLARIENAAQKQEDKEGIIKILDDILEVYAEAHPMLLAEKARHKSGKI
jgi:PAS domain S-box-containing protein